MTILPTSLSEILASIVLIVGSMLLAATLAIVGPGRLRQLRHSLRDRLTTIAPSIGFLLFVLVLTNVTRGYVPEISWIIGLNITGVIHELEGAFIARVQSVRSPVLTGYFSFMYVYGYVFLLVFPFIGYGALEDLLALKQLIVSYIANYVIGLASYTAFIAYGPRNLMPDTVEPLLYTAYPEFQLLTSQINTNTNVFPSLHASLSITVALLAYRTRAEYPRWTVVAAAIALSVTVSTMYLGIHWAIDVIAGAVLAVASVAIATRYAEARLLPERWDIASVED